MGSINKGETSSGSGKVGIVNRKSSGSTKKVSIYSEKTRNLGNGKIATRRKAKKK